MFRTDIYIQNSRKLDLENGEAGMQSWKTHFYEGSVCLDPTAKADFVPINMHLTISEIRVSYKSSDRVLSDDEEQIMKRSTAEGHQTRLQFWKPKLRFNFYPAMKIHMARHQPRMRSEMRIYGPTRDSST